MKFDFRLRTYSVTFRRPQVLFYLVERMEDGGECLVFFLAYKSQKPEFFSARAFGARVPFMY